MQINSVGPNWIPQLTPAPALRGVSGVGPMAPVAPKVEPLETNPAADVTPQAALRSWLGSYVKNQNQLYDRIQRDSSAEATMFRRGLMISGVVPFVAVAE